jgi:hypothetical protein
MTLKKYQTGGTKIIEGKFGKIEVNLDKNGMVSVSGMPPMTVDRYKFLLESMMYIRGKT